ncbi:hypothetical protein C7974DRAFT_280672, partial [Boeremia exigua]|uniref:uncharacterized protein n=1 Tax=Boeremia exigua TaxID=749465 RepID=UPI001E8CFBFC
LFNNPTLSDVTIKQIAQGKVREYHAHKAILSADSSYFFRAFTDEFKASQPSGSTLLQLTTAQEASQPVIEIHDDHPDHFEFLLKYIYTYEYDKAAIRKLAAGDAVNRVLIPIGIQAIADKYDV